MSDISSDNLDVSSENLDVSCENLDSSSNNNVTVIEISKANEAALRFKIETHIKDLSPDPEFFYPAKGKIIPSYDKNKKFVLKKGVKMIVSKPTIIMRDMVRKAILDCPTQMLKSSQIYQALLKKYPYFKIGLSISLANWKSSVRNTLSNQKYFAKIKIIAPEKNSTWYYWGVVLSETSTSNHRVLSFPIDNFTLGLSDSNNDGVLISVVPPSEKKPLMLEQVPKHILTTDKGEPKRDIPEQSDQLQSTNDDSILPRSWESQVIGPPSSHVIGPSSSKVIGPSSSKVIGPSSSHVIGPSSSKVIGSSSSQVIGPSSSHVIGPSSPKVIGQSSPKVPKSQFPSNDFQLEPHQSPLYPSNAFTNITTPKKSIMNQSLLLYSPQNATDPSSPITKRRFGSSLTNSGPFLKTPEKSPFSSMSPLIGGKDPLLSFAQIEKKKCSRRLNLLDNENLLEDYYDVKNGCKENVMDGILSPTKEIQNASNSKDILPFIQNELETLEGMSMEFFPLF